MTREELIRIVNIFKNDGFDVVTGKKLREREITDLMDEFDGNVNHPEGVNIIFGPEDFGLKKDASAEEIVDFALMGKRNE